MACIITSVNTELPVQARTRLLSRKRPSGRSWRNPDWHGLTILTRNPLFFKLTLVLMLNGIVSEGLWEIMTQYLQLKLGFNTLDNVRALSYQRFEAYYADVCCVRGPVGAYNMMPWGCLIAESQWPSQLYKSPCLQHNLGTCMRLCKIFALHGCRALCDLNGCASPLICTPEDMQYTRYCEHDVTLSKALCTTRAEYPPWQGR